MNFNKFTEYSTIILAGFTGILIAMPIALSSQNYIPPFLGFLMGSLIGYKKRKSRLFFYICLMSIMILSALIYLALDKN